MGFFRNRLNRIRRPHVLNRQTLCRLNHGARRPDPFHFSRRMGHRFNGAARRGHFLPALQPHAHPLGVHHLDRRRQFINARNPHGRAVQVGVTHVHPRKQIGELVTQAIHRARVHRVNNILHRLSAHVAALVRLQQRRLARQRPVQRPAVLRSANLHARLHQRQHGELRRLGGVVAPMTVNHRIASVVGLQHADGRGIAPFGQPLPIARRVVRAPVDVRQGQIFHRRQRLRVQQPRLRNLCAVLARQHPVAQCPLTRPQAHLGNQAAGRSRAVGHHRAALHVLRPQGFL